MKQNITTKQLDELSEKGKERLINFIDSVYPNTVVHSVDLKGVWLPLLSIGQMIEFLTYERPHGHLCYCTELKESAKHGWRVIKAGKEEKDILVIKETEELCDALWEAVKDILNEK